MSELRAQVENRVEFRKNPNEEAYGRNVRSLTQAMSITDGNGVKEHTVMNGIVREAPG